MTSIKKYWINTISFDHVQRGVKDGFTQANHGSQHNLKRLGMGDGILFYSPKTAYENGMPLQAFTALGYIDDNEPYQFEMSGNFHPFRRNVVFKKVNSLPIRPILEELDFIKDKQHWGFIFRRGMFEISKEDFMFINDLMLKNRLK